MVARPYSIAAVVAVLAVAFVLAPAAARAELPPVFHSQWGGGCT